MYWTDDPVADAEAWYCEQERRQEEWERQCEKCVICGEPIDPNWDTKCINLIGHLMHKMCVSKLLNKAEKDVAYKSSVDVFYLIEEALEETCEDITPVPED